MEFIENMKFLWENEFVFMPTFFWCLLSGTILFFILAILCDAKFLVVFCSCGLFAFYSYAAINGIADDIKRDNLEKQKKIEEQQRKDHISKMCFNLDTSIESDLKKDELQEKPIYALYKLSNSYYFDLEKTQNAYYEKNQNSDGFSDNKELIKKYSQGYKNLLEIQKEIGNRRTYCFKNYCGDTYYKSELDDIDSTVKYYIELKCKKGVINEFRKND